MTALLQAMRADGGRRLAKYSAVSLFSVACTQVLLLLAQRALGLAPVAANTLAVSLAAIPVFLLNRAWVWGLDGRASFRREVVPFWTFTLLGLVVSTLAVAAVATVTAHQLVVAATNIGAFGLLWVAKFVVLDEIVFAAVSASPAPAVAPAAESLELVSA